MCNNETERCYAEVTKKKTSYWTYISLRSGLKIQQQMRRHIKYRDFQKTIVFNLILMVFNSLFSFFGFSFHDRPKNSTYHFHSRCVEAF